ncbi:GNAT family N-acetyltransferase [Piscinibacter sakaiensis]|uniref:GNAT family N-acetyltransferase n=1 Tax=Piscinibacter sakaiensis TaxID=1547922 RepID=UPI003AAAA299
MNLVKPTGTGPGGGAFMHPSDLNFSEIDVATGSADVASFLAAHAWPFHTLPRLDLAAAASVPLGPPDQVRSFWISQHGKRIGVIRLLDLDDVADGSVRFDLRVAEESRGRGVGRHTVCWLTDTLFRDYPSLHRIEATTRFDNLPMRRALEANGYRLEGRLRETWPSADGVRHDTALYGRLRSDTRPDAEA